MPLWAVLTPRSGINFYRLPGIISHQGEKAKELSKKRQDIWLSRIHPGDLGPEKYSNTRVCSLHFVSGICMHVAIIYIYYSILPLQIKGKPSQLFDENNVDWAPSINLGHESAPSVSSDRYDPAVQRERNKRRRTEPEPEPDDTMVTKSIGTQTVITMNEVESLMKSETQHVKELGELRQTCAQLEQDNTRLRAETKELREQITKLDEEFFKDDDEKVKFYTGLTNWNLLVIVMQFVQPFLNRSNRSTLSAFQQLIMTLMRLRLGLSGQDLGYRFGIHRSTVSRIFTTVTYVLF